MSRIGPELLARLLDEYGPVLELYSRQWTDSPADVVQQAFVQLINQPRLPEQVVPWLYRTVRNGAISARRSTERRRHHEHAAGTLGVSWFDPNRSSELDPVAASEALAELPLEEREIIVAHLWGGLSFEAIAELVDMSSSTAHRRYQAGLETLRRKLGVSCSQGDHKTEN